MPNKMLLCVFAIEKQWRTWMKTLICLFPSWFIGIVKGSNFNSINIPTAISINKLLLHQTAFFFFFLLLLLIVYVHFVCTAFICIQIYFLSSMILTVRIAPSLVESMFQEKLRPIEYCLLLTYLSHNSSYSNVANCKVQWMCCCK